MKTKRLFNKRKGLSRVLTEIIFLLLATTTAIGAYTIYNDYSSNMSGTAKIVIEQVDIIASQNKAYVTIKNVGTTVIQKIKIAIAEKEGDFTNILITPGHVRTLTIDLTGTTIDPGKQYTIVAKVLDDKNSTIYTTTYVTTAKL